MLKREVSTQYDRLPLPIHHFNFKIAKKYIKNKKVLDIGCWTGQFERLAIGVVKKIIGIDPAGNAIKYAKAHIPKASFFIGSANRLSFEKNVFDVVVLLDVIEHVLPGTEEDCFKEINRVLKRNGRLILATPNKHLLSILLDPAFFILGHRHYSINDLEIKLKRSGFLTEKVFIVGGSLYLLNHIFELCQKHFFGSHITYPKKINELIATSCSSKGFAEIYLIGRKTKNQ